MKNTWRLTTDLLALFFNGQSTKTGEIFQNVVAFCPVEKKTFKNNLIKLVGVSYKEITLTNNDFNVRVNSKGELEIKSNQFPNPKIYYSVCNRNISKERLSSEVGYLISNLTSDKGEFSNYNFEIAFSNNDNLSIKFICKEMDIYKDCLNELNRRTKCELLKKTKTFIPGHRYESLEESIIYLGKFKSSRLIDKNESILFTNDILNYQDVYLYIDANELTEDEKSIKDIFNNRYYSNSISTGIKETRKLKPMVDSGEVIVNDIDSSFDIKNYALKIINNLEKDLIDYRIKIPISNEKTTELIIYNSEKKDLVKDIFLPLVYHSECNFKEGKDSKEIKDIIKNNIKNIIKLSIFEGLNNNIFDSKKLTSIKEGDSILNDLKVLLSLNYLSSEWSPINNTFVDYLSINFNDGSYLTNNEEFDNELKSEINECLDIINNISLISFEDYYKLTPKLLHNNFYSRQRENTCSYYKLEVITIESLFGKSNFTETLKNICRDAITNSGENTESFLIKNVGTRKSPLYYVSMSISLDNIVQYFGGVENVPDDIVTTIKYNKFNSLKIDIDLDINDIK